MNLVVYTDCGLEGLTFKKPSLCKPQFAKDCDISIIVNRFMKTGQLPDVTSKKPLEGDFTNVGDFAEIQQRVVETRQAFDMLPLEVRNKFNNDPVAWFETTLKEQELNQNPKPEPNPEPELKPEPEPESEPKA